jgi:hypothetical protein
MSFDVRVPGPPLSTYVAMLWHCEGYVAPHAFERVLPGGTVQFLLPLTDEPLRAYEPQDIGRYESYRGPLLCGARSEFTVVDATSQRSMMGVQFKAGGALNCSRPDRQRPGLRSSKRRSFVGCPRRPGNRSPSSTH